MSQVTLKDIAQEAGVSISTVSLVLSGKKKISQEVRDKVYDVARKLGYIKSVYGSSLANKRINHIAVLVYEDYEKAFEWNLVRQMIIHLESVITKDHYYPVIIPVSIEQPTNDILEKVIHSRAGGLFSIHYGNAELFQKLEERGIPVVIVNNSSFQNQFHTVCIDDFQGAYEGTRHLLSLGHKRIGYIDYHKPHASTTVKDRFAGFKTALDEAHLRLLDEARATVDLHDIDSIKQKIGEIFAVEQPPTALFVHDDYLAAQVSIALQDLQVMIPNDVSLIAPGDTLDYNQAFIPRISTMSINTDLMGTLAGEMLLRSLRNAPNSLNVLKVNQVLIDRGSCKKI